MTGSISGKVQSSLVVKIIHDGELLAIKLGLIYLVLYTSYHVVCPWPQNRYEFVYVDLYKTLKLNCQLLDSSNIARVSLVIVYRNPQPVTGALILFGVPKSASLKCCSPSFYITNFRLDRAF